MYKVLGRVNRVIWERPGNRWKKIEFDVIDDLGQGDPRLNELETPDFDKIKGMYLFSQAEDDVKNRIIVTGTFETGISQLDVQNGTDYYLYLEDDPKRDDQYKVTRDVKLIDWKRHLADKDLTWVVLMMKRIGFPKHAYAEVAKSRSKKWFEDFVELDDETKMIEKAQELSGVGASNSHRIVSKFVNSIRALDLDLNSFQYELLKLGYQFSDAKMELILRDMPLENERMDVIKNDFYSLMKVSGMSYKTVDQLYLSNKSNHLWDENRITSMVMFILGQVFDEHSSWYSINELAHKLTESTLDSTVKAKIIQAFKLSLNKLIEQEEIVMFKPKTDGPLRVMTREDFNFEKNTQAMLKMLSQTKLSVIDDESIDAGIKQAESIQGFEFTEEQKEVIRSIVNSPVSTINGYAGTGKSSIVRASDIILNSAGLNLTQVAFTGRASDSLSRSTGFNAKTVHATFKIMSESDEDILKKYISKLKFNKTLTKMEADPNARLPEMFTELHSKAIIVDEYPTLSIVLFSMLLHQALVNKARLILIGDSGQLPAIRFSSDQAVNDSIYPKHHELSQVKRQGNGSSILDHSLKVRSGKLPEEVINSQKIRATFNDINYDFVANQQQAMAETKGIFDMLARKVKSEGKTLRDVAILSPMNDFNDKLNRMIQSEVAVGKQNSFTIGPDKSQIKVFKGELIVNKKNNYDGVYDINDEPKSIFNGNVGVVTNIYKEGSKKYMTVDFGLIGIIVFCEGDNQTKDLDLAYAMTVHKAQGSTVDYVITVLPDSYASDRLLSKQILYTAMTRARKALYVVSSKKTLQKCVRLDVSNNARSNLDIINDEIEGTLVPSNAKELRLIKEFDLDGPVYDQINEVF